MSDDWRRVNDLFHAALERPAAERRSFVIERAGADERLRDEALSLLQAHDRAGEFLESPAVPPGVDDVSPGDLIGNYRIERELGRGGMGVVYLAEDTRLGRQVALKALAPSCTADEPRRERLRREARAAAQLSHPGIATVFALEEIDGNVYIAAEYLPGRTLREELEGGPVPVERVLQVGVQIAQALDAAHARQVVHRDLKPENVVCAAAGVKILDFGIARSPATRDLRLTEAGTIVGTPGYMSPEQIEARDVDFRSDIFSFGVLLYELATGVHPFEGTSPASTIARILTIEPCPPGELRPLPADFDRIVRKCLHKRPDDRYQATSELAADLQRLIEAPPGTRREPALAGKVIDRPATAWQAARWWRVHQVSVVCLYAVMTALAGFVNAWVRSDWSVILFFACVAAAALNGTLRVHLLFTQRHNVPAFRGELRRAAPWMRGSDVLLGLALVALASGIARTHHATAILLAAVGAGTIIVSVAVEPATTDAAFARRSSGARRR